MILFLLCFVLLLSKGSAICEEGKACKLTNGREGLCFAGECLTQVLDEPRENLTFKIIVRYPEDNINNFNNTGIYIRGNGLGLQWDSGKQLLKTGTDNWEIILTYKSSNQGFQCQSCSAQGVQYLPGNKFQYRVLMNDSKDMIGANFAIHFPISQTSSYFTKTAVFVVYPWFHNYVGSLHTFDLVSKYIGEKRSLSLYTPPSFMENLFKSYPTLIVLDFTPEYAKFFRPNFEYPIINSIAEEYILVGFGDYKDNWAEREHIVSPVPGYFSSCINGTYADYCGGCIPENATAEEYVKYLYEKCGKQIIYRGQGDKTLDFLTLEALPMVDELFKNRVEKDRLGIMGYSLAGLLSCYAAWTRPHVFSYAACQSPSFWWPNSNETISKPMFHFINETLKDPKFYDNRTDQKFYIDVGGEETVAPYYMAQSAVEVGHFISRSEHFKLDTNVWVNVYPHKSHNLKEWAHRMGHAIKTLLPSNGEPNMPVPITNDTSVLNGSRLCLLLLCLLVILNRI